MRLQSVVLVVALIFEILQRIVEFIDRIIPYSICAVNNQIGHVSEANKWLMRDIIMLITTSRNTFLYMLDVFMAFLCFGVIIMFENLMLLHNNDMLIAIFLSPPIPILYHRIIRNLNVNINSSDNLVTGTKEVYKLLEYEKKQFLSLKFFQIHLYGIITLL